MPAPYGFVVALTGGIGSGKSKVADLLRAHGAAVVDTDQLAHALTAPDGAAIDPIRATFGPAFIDSHGALDRAAMRQLAFTDETVRQKLQAILHPLIQQSALAELTRLAGTAPFIVMDIPLLAETGRGRYPCDRVLVVDCPETLQIERVMQRNGLSPTEVEAIMARQASRAERLAIADDILINDGSLEKLALETQVLAARYTQMAADVKYSETDACCFHQGRSKS